MLAKVTNPEITTATRTLTIASDAEIFTKILTGPRCSGRTAIYIHGGGTGGNHTLIERPSRHLIEDGFFDTVILPDRRGDGASSPLTGKYSVLEHAQDMRALLDRLEVAGPITAMGVSYGGPIALDLAAIDPRVERVILVASSPTLSSTSGLTAFLAKSGLLRRMFILATRRFLGKLPPAYTDFDPAYDAKNQSELVKAYTDALKRTPRERRDSLLYALESTLDESKAGLDEHITLTVPVIQIVGERDEVWGSQLLPEYRQRFPNYTQVVVAGARIHKDVFLKPGLFYTQLAEALRACLSCA
ncbi:MAG TPA: alpha/beta hydrolase [Anaerolineaceae bacterium]|nr:alpha/beta hydrolase [Anaerolineaceae bacterium]